MGSERYNPFDAETGNRFGYSGEIGVPGVHPVELNENVGVIVNPYAGKRKKFKKRFTEYQNIVEPTGVAFLTEHPDQITESLDTFVERDISVIAIAGGDGTIHAVMNRILPYYSKLGLPFPVFLPLGGGTMNGLFGEVGSRGKPLQILYHVVEALRAGEELPIIERNILWMNDILGYLFGAGFVSNITRYYYEGKGRGKLEACRLVSKMVYGIYNHDPDVLKLLTPVNVTVFHDSKSFYLNQYTFLYASTVKTTGMGFKISYLGGERPGHFHIVGALLSLSECPRNVISFYLGRPLKARHLLDAVTNVAVLRSGEPIECVLDGEFYTFDKEVCLRTGPSLHFIRCKRLHYRYLKPRKLKRSQAIREWGKPRLISWKERWWV